MLNDVVFAVKDIIVNFRKIKTIMILISLNVIFRILKLKSSLTLRRHCNSGSRNFRRYMFKVIFRLDSFIVNFLK